MQQNIPESSGEAIPQNSETYTIYSAGADEATRRRFWENVLRRLDHGAFHEHFGGNGRLLVQRLGRDRLPARSEEAQGASAGVSRSILRLLRNQHVVLRPHPAHRGKKLV